MKVKALRNTNIRKSCIRLVDSDLIGQINDGVTFNVVGKKFKGIKQKASGFGESDIWYQDQNGWFYWSGSLEDFGKDEGLDTIDLTEKVQLQLGEWNYNKLIQYVPDSWKQTGGKYGDNKKVKIAIIDSGFNLEHDVFKHLGQGNRYDATKDDYSNSDGKDDVLPLGGITGRPHGNQVASILVSMPTSEFNIKGTVPQAEFFFIRARDKDGVKEPIYMLNALDLAVNILEVDIITNSMGFNEVTGTDNLKKLDNIREQLRKKKIAFISALDNVEDDFDTLDKPGFPTNIKEAITVGSLSKSSYYTFRDKFLTKGFSEHLNVIMPENKIALCNMANWNKKDLSSSFATPYFAGAVALYFAFNQGRESIKNQDVNVNKSIKTIVLEAFENENILRDHTEFDDQKGSFFIKIPH